MLRESLECADTHVVLKTDKDTPMIRTNTANDTSRRREFGWTVSEMRWRDVKGKCGCAMVQLHGAAAAAAETPGKRMGAGHGVEEEVGGGPTPPATECGCNAAASLQAAVRKSQPVCSSLLHEREGPVNSFSSKPTFGSTKFGCGGLLVEAAVENSELRQRPHP
jgi:hypothetical protein